jgi:hypothetical protein
MCVNDAGANELGSLVALQRKLDQGVPDSGEWEDIERA